jgi:hypothetical protein
MDTNVSEEPDASLINAENSVLKMEVVAGSSETLADTYQTVRCDAPENRTSLI